jgi:hypothetical protein
MTRSGLIWKEPIMATKKPSEPRKKYRKVLFDVDQMPGCCGIAVVLSWVGSYQETEPGGIRH